MEKAPDELLEAIDRLRISSPVFLKTILDWLKSLHYDEHEIMENDTEPERREEARCRASCLTHIIDQISNASETLGKRRRLQAKQQVK